MLIKCREAKGATISLRGSLVIAGVYPPDVVYGAVNVLVADYWEVP